MFQKLSILTFAAVLALCLLHLLAFGRKRYPRSEGAAPVRRFSFLEVLIHAMMIVAVSILATTGFTGALLYDEMSGLLLWVHFSGAGLFTLALLLMTFRWAHENRFQPCDWQWFKMLGGYFRRGGRQAHAGRFDCGQKILFWLSTTAGLICLSTILLSMLTLFGTEGQEMLVIIHGYSALVLVVAIMVHIYVSLFAKSRAWRSMLGGKVDSDWVDYFHPLWSRDTTEQHKHEVKHEA